MPLIYVDLIAGRTPAEVQALLDTIHEAMLEAFTVPQRDRYQVVSTHPAHEVVALDTGLGITRSSPVVIVHAVSRRRTGPQKQRFYELLASKLAKQCGLDPADLVVSITENDDDDWHSATGGHSSLPASCRARNCGDGRRQSGDGGTAVRWSSSRL